MYFIDLPLWLPVYTFCAWAHSQSSGSSIKLIVLCGAVSFRNSFTSHFEILHRPKLYLLHMCPQDQESISSWKGFPDSSVGKESACNAGNPSLIPESGRSPGEGKGYPLQYSGLENSMECIVHGVSKSWTQLSDCHFTSAHGISHYFKSRQCIFIFFKKEGTFFLSYPS